MDAIIGGLAIYTMAAIWLMVNRPVEAPESFLEPGLVLVGLIAMAVAMGWHMVF